MIKIVHLINLRLNENYHTGIRCTPSALLTGFRFYDPRIRRHEVKKFEVENKEKHNEMLRLGDEVYLKNFLGNKLDDKFLGPFRIIEIGKKGLWLKLNNGEWTHLKNLKY